MKAANIIVKVLVALAAVAGAVYVIATYGDKIVAWAKKILAAFPKCPLCEEEAPVEEAGAEEPVQCEKKPQKVIVRKASRG
jgi:hypothetical protein